MVNVPVAVVVVLVADATRARESRDPEAARGYDVLGAVLGVVGLGGGRRTR